VGGLDLNKPIYHVGWAAHWNDGRHVVEWESELPFSQLPDQDKIDAVAIVYGPKHWVIRGKTGYFAGKSASITFPQGAFAVESCFIGYWEGGKKVKFSVNLKTGEPDLSYTEGG
jgi:beta-lactamase class D